MLVIVLLVALVMIDLLAWFFGADSRDRRPEHPLSGFGDTAR
jgi:uncharacterized membrane protein